ncbi:5-formyltetrahydrofolate cyclo-ligase [Arthrobacter sp. MYb213]|uniref:5-formyltetrahydrofolate cyclo-ligase n=1 Tax=Arthrobacter sp. MYb213 TaxID=1848595 RepID=UPI000CFC8FC5|nr:5-formyltetrahydrofolate cyclo-ligase [Arthrobacter sp. MYb213]PRB71299.1 5-formyltetrahydrofolate cyclo-ligase [Arthrobacter sp. MYb213]
MNAANTAGFGAEKKSRRAKARAARRALSPATRAKLAQQLAAQAMAYLTESTDTAVRVGAYLSTDEEPDTSVLLNALVDAGIEVFLPVCQPEYQLGWVRWNPGVELRRSAVAPVDEPVGPRHDARLFEQVHTLFIPALLVDQRGLRLGQGGGYYDRFLPLIEQQATRVAALVYSSEFVPAGDFPVEAHDRPVDMVITEQQFHTIEQL